MKKIKYLFITMLIILTYLSGCVNTSNSPTSAIGGGKAGTISLYSPATNDSVGYGTTLINYLVTPVGGNKSVELYIDGIYNTNYFPGVSLEPLSLILDSAMIGKRISYYLKYYDANGSFAMSDTMRNILITTPRIPPNTPSKINLVKLSPTIVNISWSDNSPAIKFYEVWRKDGFGGTWNDRFGPLSPTTFNVNDNALVSGVVYLYKIRSKNDFSYSEFSESVNTAGVGSSGNFAAPTNLVAVQLGSSPFSVKLNWDDNIPDENFFRIERNDNLSIYSDFYVVATVADNVTSYTDNAAGLFLGRTYKYRIKAFSNTDSSWSNIASVTLK